MELAQFNPYATAEIQPSISFVSFCNELIRKFESGDIQTDKGDIYSSETIRSYKYFNDTWKGFEESRGIEFSFVQVGPVLVREFTTYLQQAGKSKNSISLILSKLKASLKFAFMEGLTFWNGSGIKTPTELTTKVYLSIEELKKLRGANLTEGEERVLDAFLVQCFTGLRYDTLQKFLSSPVAFIGEYEGKSYIDITSDKTGEQSIIPLGQTVREILDRNSGKKLTFSEEYLNRTLKTIAGKSELTNPVSTRITKGGRITETLKPKNKLISTHTARRTLISLAKQSEMTDREIQGVTGHKTENQLNAYNRTTNMEKVKGILGNKFFDTQL